jgi:hypothetical protein
MLGLAFRRLVLHELDVFLERAVLRPAGRAGGIDGENIVYSFHLREFKGGERFPAWRRRPGDVGVIPATIDAGMNTESVLKWLKSHGTRATRDGMARYAIPSDKAFGVTMAHMKVLAKRLGRDHELAAALWDSGWYEARMLASLAARLAKGGEVVRPARGIRQARGLCAAVGSRRA